MKGFSFKKTVLGCSVFGAVALASLAAQAQVYYPMEIQVTNAQGQLESYTMYIPGDVQQGVAYQQQQVAVTNADGTTGYQTIFVPAVQQSVSVAPDGSYQLSSNPWDDTSSSSVQNVVAASPSVVNSVLGSSATNATAQNTLSKQTAALSTPSLQTNTALKGASSGAKGGSSSGGTIADADLRDAPLPTWVGQNTTYNTAMGQEMIAPEINKTNMLSMVAHLRSLGYIVPDSLDTAIMNAPSETRVKMLNSLAWVQHGGKGDEPILKSIAKISKDLEANYGFSFENIIDRSLKILDAR